MKKAWSFILTRTDLEFASGASSAQQPSILHERTITPSTRTVLPAYFSGFARTFASETFFAFGESAAPRLIIPEASKLACLSASVGLASLVFSCAKAANDKAKVKII